MRTAKWSMFIALWVFALAPAGVVFGESVEKSFKVEKGGRLVVDIDDIGADVHVKVWSKLEVAIRAERLDESDIKDLEIEKEGNTVIVELDSGRSGRNNRNARFTINVPSDFSLDLGTSGGDVSVVGSINGEVIAATAGGDIEVDDVSGEIDLKTAGGDITAGDVGADADAATAGGDIKIGNVDGALAAATAGGDIIVGEVKKDLEAATAGGSIRCEKVGGEADVKTSGGDIDLGVIEGGVSAKTAGGDIEILGATGEAVAKTAGGDIELTDIKGVVKAATAGGDIRVELDPSNAANSSMETKGGDITLVLPADAKVTIEAQIRLRDWDSHGRDDYKISSDFEAKDQDRNDREITARYVINGGGKVITIETVNGNIEIRKK